MTLETTTGHQPDRRNAPAAPHPQATVDTLVITVPVHDEQDLLPRCLAALDRSLGHLAQRRPDVRALAVVVLDRCTDRSRAITVEAGFENVAIDAGRVGTARAVGIRHALDLLARGSGGAPLDLERTWLACTDADSVVPAAWASHHVQSADSGADVVVGTVRPDFADLDAARREAWRATHRDGVANGHVHGANLGVRAATYVAAGGFPDVEEHEDVELVARAVAAGGRLLATAGGEVLTSGRQVGRTPGGYARHLRDDLLQQVPDGRRSGDRRIVS